MKPRNLLGYIGITLGALALVVALAGHFGGFEMGSGRQGRNNQMGGNGAQAAQPAQTAPQAQQNVQSDAATASGVQGRHGARGQQAQGGQHGAHARAGGPGFGREHGGFFGPLAWIGNLAQAGVAMAAILFGLMLLRRRGGGGSGSRPHGDVTPPEDEPQLVSNPPQPTKTVYM
jgi:hypothetical protein